MQAPGVRLKLELPGLIQEYLRAPGPGRPGPEAYLAGLAAACDDQALLLLDSGRAAFYAPPPALHRLSLADQQQQRFPLPAGKGPWELSGSGAHPVLSNSEASFHLQDDGKWKAGERSEGSSLLRVPGSAEVGWIDQGGHQVYGQAVLPGRPEFLKASEGQGSLLALLAQGSSLQAVLWKLGAETMPIPLPADHFATGVSRTLEFAESSERGLAWRARLFQLETPHGTGWAMIPYDEQGYFQVRCLTRHTSVNALGCRVHSEESGWLRTRELENYLPLSLHSLNATQFEWKQQEYESNHYGIDSADLHLKFDLARRRIEFLKDSNSDSSP
ncbi:hypothetical protein ABS71_01245 [bacterium SCN 62-11]|nr:hypothetical protein [Candidatus Eremiobacteraeota bacterium]ODT79083.1 MAG: hypothetical protein ABS71_01245 [bacterium SCN 62-11]